MSSNTEQPVNSDPQATKLEKQRQLQLLKAAVNDKVRLRKIGRQVEGPTNKIQKMIVLKEPEVHMTSSATQTQLTDSTSSKLKCEYCDIIFGDDVIHALHMSCHLSQDPFKCKICGEQCNEKYHFNEHILKGMHN